MYAMPGRLAPSATTLHARSNRISYATPVTACSPLVLNPCTPCARPFTPAVTCSVKQHASTHDGADTNSVPAVDCGAVDRRQALSMLMAGAAWACSSGSAQANIASPAPAGFRVLVDKLDGYQFLYPERWLAVTITGNDCFFRNPTNIDENLFVDFSSPSSSEYKSVTDLGTPEQTAKQILEQLLNKEFMSTRIGIKREGKVLSATSREGKDGRTYFDVAIRMTSYASRNPYVATQGEVMKDYGIEWDRVLLTTLGVANNRLYEFRLQTAQKTLEGSQPLLTEIQQSFQLRDIEVA